ncbi:MAG: hypothetical protein R8G33_06475 [Gammaproteobacteria bacterium]|nr:hypothetical protein [Gammaproteobacteria bacterium]
MGACILCGKSAGFFYSLHKSCFAKYNKSNQVIAEHLVEGLENVECDQLANIITNEIASYRFADEAQQRTLNRALEYFSKHYIEKDIFCNIDSWLALLNELSPAEALFVNKFFITQQQNLLAVEILQTGLLPESNCNPANYSIDLRETEQLWWCFNESSLEQLKPAEHKRQWSIVLHIAENLLQKKPKQSLEKKNLGEGKILLTNQRMCFDSGEDLRVTEYRDIYSCTPVVNGVRLQSAKLQAVPDTYYCEDGRLLYAFIQHAQKQF